MIPDAALLGMGGSAAVFLMGIVWRAGTQSARMQATLENLQSKLATLDTVMAAVAKIPLLEQKFEQLKSDFKELKPRPRLSQGGFDQ